MRRLLIGLTRAVLFCLAIAFDVHLAEAFVPLIYGMAAVTAPRSVLFEDLPSYIVSLGITHVGIVPSLIEATMGVMEDTGDDMPLRYIASGGEKMSDAVSQIIAFRMVALTLVEDTGQMGVSSHHQIRQLLRTQRGVFAPPLDAFPSLTP